MSVRWTLMTVIRMQSASTSTDHSAVNVRPDTTDTQSSPDGGQMDETVLVS